MKQVTITDAIRQKLQNAGADPSNVVVFEATALNSLPVRKNHPLYKGAVHSRDFLNQMRDALNDESLPLQVMHNSEPLPIGRAFFGEVLDGQNGAELRVLFWVDTTHQSTIDLVNNGTVDQVSVSVLPKTALCSACGFDFFGPDASFDNIWTGSCPDGHVMGDNGNHLIMGQLDRWFELSLVGQGGIKGARISTSSDARLAADASAASMLTLNYSLENTKMDLSKLVQELTDAKAQNLVLENEKAALIAERDAAVAARDAAVADLSARDAELVTARADIVRLSANDTARAALNDVAQHVLTISGKVGDTIPEKVEDIVALVKSSKLSLPGATTSPSERPDPKVVAFSSSAFKRRQ